MINRDHRVVQNQGNIMMTNGIKNKTSQKITDIMFTFVPMTKPEKENQKIKNKITQTKNCWITLVME